jgi:predicted Zn-dependent protease
MGMNAYQSTRSLLLKRKIENVRSGSNPLLFAGAWLFLAASAAPAQVAATISDGRLMAPNEIVLYVHAQLKSTDFVEPLLCALKRVLVAPVTVQDLNLPLTSELRASPSQFDVAKIADRFSQATASDGGLRTFKYLLVPFDMKDAQFRFVFATSFGNAATSYHVGVVSMARLEASDSQLSRHQRAEIAALRAYKLILKSIARLSGFPDTQRCILAFPKTLDELDRKSSAFCAQDHAALVAAEILKSEESAGCIYVSQAWANGAWTQQTSIAREPRSGS